MLKHQPFGWVIGDKDYENFYHIEYVYSCNLYNYYRVKLSQNDMSFNYEHLFRDFTFIDSSPFLIFCAIFSMFTLLEEYVEIFRKTR